MRSQMQAKISDLTKCTYAKHTSDTHARYYWYDCYSSPPYRGSVESYAVIRNVQMLLLTVDAIKKILVSSGSCS